MKIEEIYLKNDIGIHDGTGKREIHVDFSKQKSPIIMILGANGKGKSSLNRQLHPDVIKNHFIEGLEGEKKLTISHNGDLYYIHHKISPKGKVSCSIIKNGDENLNPNGGVRTFKEVITNELGFTDRFFSFGFIGSEISGFIEEDASSRKNLVSKFIPELGEYMDVYNATSNMMRSKKKELQRLTKMVGDFTKIDETKRELEDYNSKLQEHKERKQDLERNKIKLEIDISNIEKNKEKIISLKEDKANKIHSINQIGNQIQETENLIESTSSEIDELKKNLKDSDEINSELATLNSEIELINNDIASLTKFISSREDQIKGLQSYIGSYQQKLDSHDEINTTINNLQERKTTLSSEITSLEHKKESKSTEIHNIMDSFCSKLVGMGITIPSGNVEDKRSVFQTVDTLHGILNHFVGFINNNKAALIEIYDTTSKKGKTLESIKEEIKEVLYGIESRNKELDRELQQHKNDMKELKTLELRPSACTIDDCAFIKSALEKVDSEKYYKEGLIEYERLEKDKNEYVEKLDFITKAIEILSGFKEILAQLNNYLSTEYTATSIIKEIYNSKSINDLSFYVSLENLGSIHSTFIDENQALTDEFNEIQDTLTSKTKEYNKVLSDLSNISLPDTEFLKSEIQGYKESINRLESELNNDKTEKAKKSEILSTKQDSQKKLLEIKNENDKVQSQIKELESQNLVSSSKKVQLFNEKDVKMESLSNIEANIGDLEKSTNDELVEAMSKDLDSTKSILMGIDTKLSEINSEIEIRQSYVRDYETTKSRMADVENQYNSMDAVKQACHPSKGIPLIFINNFLAEPKRVTNELLNQVYNGKFNIDFQLDEKNFNIPVIKNTGGISKDILEVSSGQRAMTKSALCLALISTFIGKYNIVNIDELDAFLDVENKQYFLHIIKKQIEKLKIEQTFVISHNEAFFDEENINLILFEGHTAPIESKDFNIIATI